MSRRPWLLAALLGLWALPPATLSTPSLRSISATEDERLDSTDQARSEPSSAAHFSPRLAHSARHRIGKRARPRLALPARAANPTFVRALPPDAPSPIDGVRSSVPLRLRIHRFNE
ncbi:MAG TPA: hypothetical protein VGS22_03365 [Thermoanaerobaculia bacterium]|nr:hypothetical protein [Thermoanaerobaculia bacterium]